MQSVIRTIVAQLATGKFQFDTTRDVRDPADRWRRFRDSAQLSAAQIQEINTSSKDGIKQMIIEQRKQREG
jgi:hypothetical protein